ncbi:MAG: hypothetical protein J07HN4v3_00498 [Halonotius sp. J07HN4]|jgi:hypothetical protein|nr:MAG: hypothetical protein J07HN4v3_00498 [Halonotius sp. J07HN4]
MSAEPNDERGETDTDSAVNRNDDATTTPDSEVSRVFIFGLILVGVLLFSLFAWAALSRGSPL